MRNFSIPNFIINQVERTTYTCMTTPAATQTVDKKQSKNLKTKSICFILTMSINATGVIEEMEVSNYHYKLFFQYNFLI